MRTIKFRAWNKNGKYFLPFEETNDYILDPDNGQIINQKWGTEVNCELMQFTGLLDKNGKGIYEGDILEIDNKTVGIIKWDEQAAGFYFTESQDGWSHEWFERENKVIGNIYENPELLEVKP